ncbi:MAG: DUF268 domain-containing protein [Alphaproteobacteria bacterium]|nr:DUF268 domain-containing protein [Alphaproteobacteria bacterium]
MKGLLASLRNFLCAFGLDLGRFIRALFFLPRYICGAIKYKKLQKGNFPLALGSLYPVLHEAGEQAGAHQSQYFWQDLYVAKKIHERTPQRHVDIGSRIDGFIGQLITFRDVDIVDIRPLDVKIPRVTFIQDDATAMKQFADNTLESISTLNAAEHFGLGRYGDPIDPAAPEKFAQSLARVLKPDGVLYYAVPCGVERLCFNAHRIFAPQTVLDMFGALKLVKLSAILDDFTFVEDCSIELLAQQKFGCGIFEFTK